MFRFLTFSNYYFRFIRRLVIKSRYYILVFALCLGLLPFFALSFANFPFWDDYWMIGLARQMGTWTAQHHHYMNWGGRFSLVFILSVFNPLKYNFISGFYLIPLFFLGGTLIATQMGIRELTGNSLPQTTALRWAAVFLLLHLAWMPTIYPSFYWFVGGTAYQLPVILMIFVLVAGLKALRMHTHWSRWTWYFFALVGTTCVVGLQELAIILMSWTLLTLSFVSWRDGRRRALWCWGGLLLCAVIGGFVALLAPGNLARMNNGGTNNIGVHIGLLRILGNAAEHLLTFLSQPNQIIMLLLTPILFGRLLLSQRFKRPKGFRLPLYGGIAFLLGGLAICFLFYSIITPDGMSGRTLNFIWAWLFLGWLLVLWAALPEYSLIFLLRPLRLVQGPVIALLLLTLLTGVERRAWAEWLLNSSPWRAQNAKRFEQFVIAAQKGESTVEVKSFSGFVPRHISIIGETLNPEDNSSAFRHNNHVTAEWFGLDSIILKNPTIPGRLGNDL